MSDTALLEYVAGSEFMAQMAGAIPGIDEASSFAEVMKLVQSMPFEVTVFDTAPTGHTLRLLQMPDTMSNGLGSLMSMKDKFGGMLSQVEYGGESQLDS